MSLWMSACSPSPKVDLSADNYVCTGQSKHAIHIPGKGYKSRGECKDLVITGIDYFLPHNSKDLNTPFDTCFHM